MTDSGIERSAPVDADGAVPDGLLDALWAYEAALMSDDVVTLDALFAPGDGTIRGDAGGLLLGHDAIAAFRRGRGGAPSRRIGAVHVRVLGDDAAVVVAELQVSAGGFGTQTQVWVRSAEGWQVRVAYVAAPAPAVDARIWREVGTPLVQRTGPREGWHAGPPIVGERVAVKDLFAIAGHRIGAGVPAYLAHAPIETRTAPAVQALLDAGADVIGIARTDEFAYSIAGQNPHYGTPPNARVPGALPGGSSSGPVSAVALGQATIGLATDTAGSIRVPASYQGLWGLRTTHDLIPRGGMLPLAPSFDTIGWLTRDRLTLAAVAGQSIRTLASDRPRREAPRRFAIAPALLDGLEPDVQAAFRSAVDGVPDLAELDLGDVAASYEAFRVVQAYEAWQSDGAWLTAHPGSVSGAVEQRFDFASLISDEQAEAARLVLFDVREWLTRVLEERVLVLPSAASVAPQANAPAADIDRIRAQTLTLTCFAGIAGAPAVSAPYLTVGGAPLGVCFVGPRFSDVDLLNAAAEFPMP